MKERIYISSNKKKWKKYEEKIKGFESVKTEELCNIYRDVLSDLAFAQSQYPESNITTYLNNLARQTHEKIYSPRSGILGEIKKALLYEVPKVIADSWNMLMLSLCSFSLFVIVGCILAIMDEGNIETTLGPGYVEMTIENIKKGVPTNVYNMSKEFDTFIGVWFNNLSVAFKMYGMGILPVIGPMIFLHVNGIMLGEFQSLFFLHGCGFQSMTAIWIHGTLEILGIIIEGTAALTLGWGWLFPGTYSRKESLKRSGMQSIKIMASCLPIITAAALLEGYITRHTEMPLAAKLTIMAASLVFMVYYYFWLPFKIKRANHEKHA